MIDVEMFSKHLYTRYYPDPDLLIRTSGEMRLSNFLLWQLSYTEMYVTPKLWPDFTSKGFVRGSGRFWPASAPIRRGSVVEQCAKSRMEQFGHHDRSRSPSGV